jgi:uncharacterized membrane protein
MDMNYNETFENNKDEDRTPELVVTGGGFLMFGILGFLIWLWLFILGLIWVVGGISAFFASLVCMFYDASIADKLVGLFLAISFGPLYWGFYIYKASYCTRHQPVNYYYQ